MEANEWLVIAMMVSLVGLMLTGFPVAWVLGGLGVLFAGFGWLADMYLDTATGLDFLTLGLVVNRIYQIMDNWCWWPCRCSSTWASCWTSPGSPSA